MRLLKRYWQFFLLALLWVGSCHAQKVLIVEGDGNAGFAEASGACVRALTAAGVADSEILVVNRSVLGTLQPTGDAPRIVITLGSESLVSTLKWIPARSTLLAGLIPRSAFERATRDAGKRSGGALSAIYLDQPLTRQVEALRLLFPNAKNVGVVFGPESQATQPIVASALRSRGLEMQSATVGTGLSVFAALKFALDSADVLLALADTQVFNSGTIANILLTTYSAQIPMVAFSPAYVRAGALMAVYSTPAQIGNDLGNVTSSFLQTGKLPLPHFPTDFEIAFNASVARSLGIQMDAATLTDRLRRLEKRP